MRYGEIPYVRSAIVIVIASLLLLCTWTCYTGEIVTNAHYHSHHGIDPLVTPPHVPLSTLLTSPPPPA